MAKGKWQNCTSPALVSGAFPVGERVSMGLRRTRGNEMAVILRACDFFAFAQNGALIIKELTPYKWPKTEKNHKL